MVRRSHVLKNAKKIMKTSNETSSQADDPAVTMDAREDRHPPPFSVKCEWVAVHFLARRAQHRKWATRKTPFNKDFPTLSTAKIVKICQNRVEDCM
mmetsp:Transcript_48446/g.97477  ORF Transcript_48446/g.97477 Transcript_48446/m.97477 type:complete len:96 (-) Transcript_48446:1426-1713(-)